MRYIVTVKVITDNPNVTTKDEWVEANSPEQAREFAEYNWGAARIIMINSVQNIEIEMAKIANDDACYVADVNKIAYSHTVTRHTYNMQNSMADFNRYPTIEYVSDIPADFELIIGTTEVSNLNDENDCGFGCYFARIKDGEIVDAYGVYGIIPYNDARVYRVI